MKSDLLKKIFIFSDLNQKDIDSIAQLFEKKEFSSGEMVFKENDAADNFYIIESGKIEILKSTVADQMKSLAILEAGNFLGEFALFTENTRSANARCLENTVVWTINRNQFTSMCDSNHTAGYKILKKMTSEICERLNKTNQKFQDHVFWGLTSLM